MHRTKSHNDRFSRFSDIGCIVCRNLGYHTQAEVHHITRGGRKRDHDKTIPLCPHHHRGEFGQAVHNGYRIFAAAYGTETDLLNQVNDLLQVKA